MTDAERSAVGPPARPPVGPAVPGWSPRQPLRPTLLEGRAVAIRPLRLEDAEAFYDALGGPDLPRDLFTYLMSEPPTDLAEMGQVVADAISVTDGVALAILVDGTVVGMATYMREAPGVGVVEVGNILYSPRLQRTTAATEAMYLLMRHAFDAGYRRYEWKCDDLNAPSRSAAERLGFTYEGTFRQALVYKGRNRDTAWYAITDADWPAVRDAFERWLDPANHADGSPRRSLRSFAPRDSVEE